MVEILVTLIFGTITSFPLLGYSEVGGGLNMSKLQQLTYTIDTNKILKILVTPNFEGYQCDTPPTTGGGSPFLSILFITLTPVTTVPNLVILTQ